MLSPELLRLVAIVAVIGGTVYLYQSWNMAQVVAGAVDTGLTSLQGGQQGGWADDGAVAAHTTSPLPVKTTDHAQVDGIERDEQHMAQVQQDQLYKNNTNVLPHPQMSNSSAPQGNFEPSQMQNFASLDCFPKDQLSAQDLIPREDAYNAWNQSNPAVQGALSNKNFVDSGHHFGLNTVGQSLKNPNKQLRSDPMIPQRQVGPWMQSTIEADTNRKPFEVGGF